ncbi:hypothetical protein SAMD00019534_035700 [Acytostelium subglobosum LB1]|uniref:hypothetical protein n=1 Tax=Acytostelium subglobosum LB1 TaxID=1410327 RepID=UPI0006450268|nr:hypothetical protein SAMD00019534_035700 [Acytostelium subglobosum LB1]GAM20395.1 hypothetical protein SAMD00019534_035700 [Acytostelium subglobosum LB1]|eukprot:XP_012759916.1 hypothetical protein SAMD00019534_035700 [Acytostelium subglobosum LB1]
MICSISGEVPEQPVVSVKTGNVYERRLIEKFIDANGKEPTTGEPLTVADLVTIKSPGSRAAGGVGGGPLRPRTSTATSIPSMLQMFQNEWDALMLETFTLKQQFETVRQELAHSLYQYDASCRVIARLIKERDQARSALANVRLRSSAENNQSSDTSMQVDSELSEDVKGKIIEKSKELTQQRRQRAKQAAIKTEQYETMTTLLSTNPHKSSAELTCLDYHPNQSWIVTGGADNDATIYDMDNSKVVATFKGHTKRINRALFHPTEDLVATASADKTVRVWKSTGGAAVNVIKKHSDEVTGISLHPLGNYLATSSLDATWALHDIHTGATLMTVDANDGNDGYRAISFHPDGIIIGLGSVDRKLTIWDVTSKSCQITLEGHTAPVTALAFSENGFHMATCDDKTVRIWDLRQSQKPQQCCVKTIDFPGGQVKSLAWDPSGNLLAIAGNGISIYANNKKKDFIQVKTINDDNIYTDLKWSSNSNNLVTTSMDSTLKLWGNQ